MYINVKNSFNYLLWIWVNERNCWEEFMLKDKKSVGFIVNIF